MINLNKSGLGICLVGLLAGCSSTPEKSPMMTELENDLNNLVAKNDVYQYAETETSDAVAEVEKAQKMFNKDADEQKLKHQVYLAEKTIGIAEQTYTFNKESEYIEQAQLKQKDVLLGAKERQIEEAQAGKMISDVQAQAAYEKNAQLQEQLNSQEQRLSSQQQQMSASEQKLQQMDKLLKQVSTSQSDRGLVISVSDINFNSGNSEVGSNTRDQLEDVAEFLKSYPDRAIAVEGYTDSTGSAEFNRNLSKLRAQAVLDELVDMGISEDRLDVRAYGESFPVADNNTSQGREMNRRVEIVMANDASDDVEDRETSRMAAEE